MNERIKLLAEQCTVSCIDGRGIELNEIDVEKFAELIVRECARRSYLDDSGNPEVEEALEFWRKDMLQHFGVNNAN